MTLGILQSISVIGTWGHDNVLSTQSWQTNGTWDFSSWNTIFGEIIEMSVRLNDCFGYVCLCKLQKRTVCGKSHIARLLLVWHRELWPCVFWTSICCWFRHHIEDIFALNVRFWCGFSSWNLMGIFYHSVHRRREGCFGAWFFGDPRGFSCCCTLYHNLHKRRLAWKLKWTM